VTNVDPTSSPADPAAERTLSSSFGYDGLGRATQNLADAFVTWATFGIASAGAGAIRSLGELDKELAVSRGAFVATRGTVELPGLISRLAGCTISQC
jgi:hypothetical protein